MVDWTVLGIAALGTAGTIGAGALGFAGPSWNERRIQAARDHKELRQAIRLVKAELKAILIALRTRDESAEDTFADYRVFSLIPAQDKTEWHHRRETIALLTEDDDDATWARIADFHILLGLFSGFLERGPEKTPESALESVAGNLPQLIAMGKDAESRLDSLVRSHGSGSTHSPISYTPSARARAGASHEVGLAQAAILKRRS